MDDVFGSRSLVLCLGPSKEATPAGSLGVQLEVDQRCRPQGVGYHRDTDTERRHQTTQDARLNDELEARGDLALPWPTLFRKDITIGMGRDHDLRYNAFLRDLIIAGRAKPSFVVSHRLPLEEAPDAFRRFDRREDGYLKVILDPAAG